MCQTVCGLEMSRMRQPRHDFDCCTTETKSVPRISDCNENLNTVIVFNSNHKQITMKFFTICYQNVVSIHSDTKNVLYNCTTFISLTIQSWIISLHSCVQITKMLYHFPWKATFLISLKNIKLCNISPRFSLYGSNCAVAGNS